MLLFFSSNRRIKLQANQIRRRIMSTTDSQEILRNITLQASVWYIFVRHPGKRSWVSLFTTPSINVREGCVGDKIGQPHCDLIPMCEARLLLFTFSGKHPSSIQTFFLLLLYALLERLEHEVYGQILLSLIGLYANCSPPEWDKNNYAVDDKIPVSEWVKQCPFLSD